MGVPSWLIVRGVRTTDQLQALGLPMAQSYDEADVVALIGNDNKGLVVKGATETTVVNFVDVESNVGRIATAINSIRRAVHESMGDWEECNVIGMFLFYWPIALDSVDVVIDAVQKGEAARVEMAAELFIATSFGSNLAALGTLPPDDHRSDAAGHAAN